MPFVDDDIKGMLLLPDKAKNAFAKKITDYFCCKNFISYHCLVCHDIDLLHTSLHLYLCIFFAIYHLPCYICALTL